MIGCFLGDAFGFFPRPFWSTVLLCGAWLQIFTQLKLLNRVVSGARFLTKGVLECGIAHRRSVAVLFTLCKIRSNPMHHFYYTLPMLDVLVRVICGASVADRYTYAPPLFRTSQHQGAFIPFSRSLWNDVADPVFDGLGLVGFKSIANGFLLA